MYKTRALLVPLVVSGQELQVEAFREIPADRAVILQVAPLDLHLGAAEARRLQQTSPARHAAAGGRSPQAQIAKDEQHDHHGSYKPDKIVHLVLH